MGLGELLLCSVVLIFAIRSLELQLPALRTLAFIVIVFGNQATTYNNRTRGRLWSTRPSAWLIASSIIDILIASTLAIGGLAMQALPAWVVLGTLAASIAFALIWDLVKVPLFQRLRIA
jgi:H+-transporting ATPase